MAMLTQEEVLRWMASATGKFHYTKILDGQVSPDLYPQVRAILHRLQEKGLVFPVDSRDGWWRAADISRQELQWWENAEPDFTKQPVKLPLGLNDYCQIFLPAFIIVAGTYNAGKTAMAMQIVNLNIEGWGNKISFFVSEAPELLRMRFQNISPALPMPPPFKTYLRTEKFQDVINPNGFNVVDYLRVDMSQPYSVSNDLFQLYNKIKGKDAVCVVCMQKPPGRKLAFGGASTAFEPSLYISIDREKLQFEKIKVIPHGLEVDPYNTTIRFKIHKGVNFEFLGRDIDA